MGSLEPLLVATGCALLALAVSSRPYYFPLLAIPIAANWRRQRPAIAIAAVAAIAATLIATVGLNLMVRDTWSSYAGERQSFTAAPGFPGENQDDGGAEQRWGERLEVQGTNSWTGAGLLPFPIQPSQVLWNTSYFFIGRTVGVFPYFLPFVLGLLAFRSDRVTLVSVVAILAVVALFFVARPFNFYGGGGALANRYFLPVYPALWFLARRPISWVWPVGVFAVAGLALLPTWLDPDAFWRHSDGRFHHVSPIVERFLPYETTQSQLKPSDTDDFHYRTADGRQLWMKPLGPRVRVDDDGRRLQVLPGLGTTEVVVASPAPIRSFRIRIDGGPPRVARFRRPSARHRMWWSLERWNLYRFALLEGEAQASDADLRVTIEPLFGRDP